MRKGYLSEVFVSFQGEGMCAGRRQLFIRLSGCNLRCRYCDTPGSLEKSERYRVFGVDGRVTDGANPVSPEDVWSLVTSLLGLGPVGLGPVGLGPVDGVALTGGEPLLQEEFLCELLAGNQLPRPRLLETNGMLPDRLVPILPLIDVVSMDIKLPSNTGEPGFWSAHAEFLALARGKVYVKILVDAGTATAEVERAAQLVRDQAADTPVFLQPITAMDGHVDLTPERLHALFSAARRRVGDLRMLPQAHKILGIQ